MFKDLKIATLTAVYNSGKYFHDCLLGIMLQRAIPDFCVIVDDGSTDNSVEVITNRIKSFRNVEIQNGTFDGGKLLLVKTKLMTFVFFQMDENRGPAAARNIGLKYLQDKVDVICIADSDDVLYEDKIKNSVEVLLKYPQVALVYSDYDIFDEKKNTITREFKEPFSMARLFQECIVSNNSVISTSILNKIGFYDESLYGPEDYDMWLRIGENACAYHIPKSLYKYRVSGNNITITTPSEKFAAHVQRVREKAVERMKVRAEQ